MPGKKIRVYSHDMTSENQLTPIKLYIWQTKTGENFNLGMTIFFATGD
jgi:hypothetical protein